VSGASIDEAAFANLVEITGGDLEFVDELVDTYLADGADQIEALRAAAASGAVDDLVRPAHAMKSSSLNVGALDLGELARRLEEAARGGQIEDAAGLVTAIEAAFATVRADLLAERERRSPG
jgi:HPt (histidine-containing phosphotransfer) domain-containing protein